MIIKKSKKLYTLILTLNFMMLTIFTMQNDNSNKDNIKNNELEELSPIADNTPSNNTILIDFEIYEPIINNLMQLFGDAMENSIEFNNKSQKEMLEYLETIGMDRVQPIVIKYMNNIKKKKSSQPLETITLNDLKIFLNFLHKFMLTIDNKNIEDLNIDGINSIEELNKIIKILNDKNNILSKSIKKVEIKEFEEIIENISHITNSMITLTSKILTNLNKGKYINHGIYNSIVHPGRKSKSKENISIAEYQNEFLFPYLQEISNSLQKQLLLLHEIRSLSSEEIPEKKLKTMSRQILDEMLRNIATIEYLLIESKFNPKNKKFSIKDKKIINEEKEHIEKKSIEHYKKLIKKHNINNVQSDLTNKDELLKDINSIKETVNNCTKTELKLTLFFFQNYYRECVFSLEKISNTNDFTKFLKNIFDPQNWIIIGSTFVGIDFYKWLSGKKGFGFCQSIAKSGADFMRWIERRADNDYNEFSCNTVAVRNYLFELEQAKRLTFENYQTPNLSIVEAEKNQEARTDFQKELKKKFDKELNVLSNPEDNKEVENSYLFLNSNPYFNEQVIWCEKTLKQYYKLLQKNNAIENKEKNEIYCLITSETLNSWKPEKTLAEDCKKRGIKDLSNLDKIIRLYEEKETFEKQVSAQLKIYKEGWIFNNARNSIGAALNGTPFGNVAGGIAAGFASKLFFDYIITEKGLTYYIEKFCKSFHYFMMGERSAAYTQDNEIAERIDSNNTSGPTTIYAETFSVLEQQGILVWFKEVLNFIEASLNGELYSGSEKITKCIGLFGPSGAGKTAVIKAFSNDIHRMIKENKTDIPVEFLAIDPKHFNGIINDGKKIHLDVIAELDRLVEGMRVKGGFYIVHLDEFHLFFTKDGKVSQEKLADLLKFFNDLFVKQKNFKRIGGMYVVCSTNKPQFIPHEFFDNGDRIGEVYEIKYPNGEQIISILKTELKNNNVFLDHIDFDYLAPLLEGCNLTYGTIIKIANKAFNIAKIKNRMIDNEIIYYAINDIVRKINLYDSENNKYLKNNETKNSLAAYYSSLASVAINFNSIKHSVYDLDMITILPLKRIYSPQHIDRLYLKPEISNPKLGGAFYAKNNSNDNYSKEAIAIEIIKSIAPIVYLDSENIPKIQKQNELAYIYDFLYNFYAAKVKYADCAKRIEVTYEKRNLSQDIFISDFNDTYSNQELHKHIIDILTYAEKELLEFYKNQEVKDFIKETTQLLKENKIVTKKNIINNAICSPLLETLNLHFNNLLNHIIEKLI
jgi:hypothetical protein